MKKYSPPGFSPNGFIHKRAGFSGAYRDIQIWGGPYNAYREFNEHSPAFGLCVRAENVLPHDAHLPIRDFDVPSKTLTPEEVGEILKKAMEALSQGQVVYVGCAGGWGRTGLVLALIVKVIWAEEVNPVEFVREHYAPQAVETASQENYIGAFDVSALRKWWFWRSWRSRLPF